MDKLTKILLLVLSLSALSTSAHAKSVTSNEYQAVVKTAYDYFNGGASGDQKLMLSAFDSEFGDVKMIKVDKETGKEVIRTIPLKKFASFFKGTNDTWHADVISVDIVDNKMAMVKLNFETPKTHYIDYLVMYKRNDKWRIVNKTFVAKNK